VDDIFQLGPIALLTSLTDHKFSPDTGKKVLSNSFKAEKGKVFVVAVLGVESPKDVTPEYVSTQLKKFAEAEWVKTHHGEANAN